MARLGKSRGVQSVGAHGARRRWGKMLQDRGRMPKPHEGLTDFYLRSP